MKLALLAAVTTCFALAGCSSSSEDGSGGDTGGPVAAAPLAGTIAGQSWTGKIAIASPGFNDDEPSKRSITIYDADVDCTSTSKASDRQILFSTEWKAGFQANLKLDFSGKDKQTITFVTGPGENVISNTGRLEIVEAPTEAKAKGKLRLRASAKENSVEGEIDVLVCER